jgi:hypothetical protein
MSTMIKEGASLEEVMNVLGGTFGGAVAKNAETAAGKMAIFKNSVAETKESIGAALLPAFEAVLPYMQSFADWAQKNPLIFRNIALAIGAIAGATIALNIALATNPFVLATAAVIGLALAFNKLVDAMSSINRIGGLAAKILGGLAMPVIGLAGNILGGLGDLSKIGQSAVGAASGMNIPRMANGGIITSPQLVLAGESGPEAIVPLGKGGGMGGIVINISGGLGTSTDIANAVYENLRFYNQNVGPLRIRTA